MTDDTEKAAMRRVVELHREAVRQVEKQGFVDLDLVERIRTAEDLSYRPLLAKILAFIGPIEPEKLEMVAAGMKRLCEEQGPALSAAQLEMMRQVDEKGPGSIQ